MIFFGWKVTHNITLERKQICQRIRIITKDQTETGYFYEFFMPPNLQTMLFDLQSFTGTKHSQGDVWFVIKYLLMLFRQHIPIPNYLNVDLGQCSAECWSEFWEEKKKFRKNEKKGSTGVQILFAEEICWLVFL